MDGKVMKLLKSVRVGVSSAKMFSKKPMEKPMKGLPDPWALMTGKELWEAIQHKKGNLDPFLMEPEIRGPATRECPHIVLSAYSMRLVGCVCNEDVYHVKYFMLHEGFPRRCYCNHWFVLERFELPKVYEDACSCPESK